MSEVSLHPLNRLTTLTNRDDQALVVVGSGQGSTSDATETRTALGLGDAATQDAADLPVSTATQTALDARAGAFSADPTQFPATDADAAAWIADQAVPPWHRQQIHDIALSLKALDLWDKVAVYFIRSGFGSYDSGNGVFDAFGGLSLTDISANAVNLKTFGSPTINTSGWQGTGVNAYTISSDYLCIAKVSDGTVVTEANMGDDVHYLITCRNDWEGSWYGNSLSNGDTSIIQGNTSGQTARLQFWTAVDGNVTPYWGNSPIVSPTSGVTADEWWMAQTSGPSGYRYNALTADSFAQYASVFAPAAQAFYYPTVVSRHSVSGTGVPKMALLGEAITTWTAGAPTLETNRLRVVLPYHGAGTTATISCVAIYKGPVLDEDKAAKLQSIFAGIVHRDEFAKRELYVLMGQSNAGKSHAQEWLSAVMPKSGYGERYARLVHAFAGGQNILAWVDEDGSGNITRGKRYQEMIANRALTAGWGGELSVTTPIDGTDWGLLESRYNPYDRLAPVFIWMQGESDTVDDATAAAYAARIDGFLRLITEDIPGVQLVLGLPYDDDCATDSDLNDRYDTVRAGITAAATKYNAVLVETNDLERSDTVHLTNASLATFVSRARAGLALKGK